MRQMGRGRRRPRGQKGRAGVGEGGAREGVQNRRAQSAPTLLTAWMVVVYVLSHCQRTPPSTGFHVPRLSRPHFFCRQGTPASDAYSICTEPSLFLTAKKRRTALYFSYLMPTRGGCGQGVGVDRGVDRRVGE